MGKVAFPCCWKDLRDPVEIPSLFRLEKAQFPQEQCRAWPGSDRSARHNSRAQVGTQKGRDLFQHHYPTPRHIFCHTVMAQLQLWATGNTQTKPGSKNKKWDSQLRFPERTNTERQESSQSHLGSCFRLLSLPYRMH